MSTIVLQSSRTRTYPENGRPPAVNGDMEKIVTFDRGSKPPFRVVKIWPRARKIIHAPTFLIFWDDAGAMSVSAMGPDVAKVRALWRAFMKDDTVKQPSEWSIPNMVKCFEKWMKENARS